MPNQARSSGRSACHPPTTVINPASASRQPVEKTSHNGFPARHLSGHQVSRRVRQCYDQRQNNRPVHGIGARANDERDTHETNQHSTQPMPADRFAEEKATEQGHEHRPGKGDSDHLCKRQIAQSKNKRKGADHVQSAAIEVWPPAFRSERRLAPKSHHHDGNQREPGR